jgi:hypothetical protein
LNANPSLFGDGDLNGIAVTSKSFVYRVVDNLVNQVVKTTGPGRTDVHSGAFTNSFEAFENLNISGFVATVFGCRHF